MSHVEAGLGACTQSLTKAKLALDDVPYILAMSSLPFHVNCPITG